MIKARFPGTYVEADVSGTAVRFFVNNPADVIQRHHMAGEFYEQEDLALIARHLRPDSRYLDVGANVGNHVIYLCRIAGLRQVTVIEPNGQAIAILRVNLRLNDLDSRVDTSLLGYGLSDRSGSADMFAVDNNLGGARFDLAQEGPFVLRTGDDLLGERQFDFVKIDVEGMEIACLRGLEGLIGRCRPALYVEVDNDNVAAFGAWCNAHGYAVQERIRRYTMNENYLVVPS